MFEKLEKFLGCNPLDRLARNWKKKGVKKILILWNRGLGDIPLWLYGLIAQVKKILPEVEFTFLTRKNLEEPFSLLKGALTLIAEGLSRGEIVNIESELKKLGKDKREYDVILESIEPKKWLKWQRGMIIPKLHWNEKEDALINPFSLEDENYIGVHLFSETSHFYDKERNWPAHKFHDLFSQIIKDYQKKILLFGFEKKGEFCEGVIDLRGETTFLQMIALIKNKCSHLIAPDSGVLCSVYYLEAQYPIRVISLWGNPDQGVLRQKVASPNKKLEHVPLVGKGKEVNNITVDEVIASLFH